MGRLEIVEKLDKFLQKHKVFKEECEVVYILSRIRKILEIENLQENYSVLNFYCNLALHSNISRTNNTKINTLLKEFIERPDRRHEFSLHIKFKKELVAFLKEKGLPQSSQM